MAQVHWVHWVIVPVDNSFSETEETKILREDGTDALGALLSILFSETENKIASEKELMVKVKHGIGQ